MPQQKRIVLCSDGTWQSANNGSRAIPSNVAKISRAIECWDGDTVQIVYYDTGRRSIISLLLTVDIRCRYWHCGILLHMSRVLTCSFLTKCDTQNVTSGVKANSEAEYGMAEGASGAGLAENVCEAYNFVVNNWSEGDEIYIFGFSRGAYTARA